MHYAKKLKLRIEYLESVVDDYYEAVYDAKDAIRNRNGLKAQPLYCGRPRVISNEEGMPIKDYEGVCELIEGLPLICL